VKKLVLMVVSCFLFACTTTTPRLTKQDDRESKALAVLSNYTGDVLAAAAVPLQYYCRHNTWPAPSSIDITQPLLSNLSGLYYSPAQQKQYQANFSLIDQAAGNRQEISNWQIGIPTIDTTKTTVQKVKIEIINEDLRIHLLNVMDFECRSLGVASAKPRDKSGSQYTRK